MTSKKGTLSLLSRKLKNPFHIWGLTGGIASGKSLAARFFREEGLVVVDADQIAKKISGRGGTAHAPILQRFGTTDRARLREMVFSDPIARKDLEAILHPLIQSESLKQMQAAQSKVILYEAALLVETGGHLGLEGLIVVDAPKEIRLRRLLERDSISEELAEKIFSAQATDETRRKAATFILDNSGAPEKLKEQVIEIARKLRCQSFRS